MQRYLYRGSRHTALSALSASNCSPALWREQTGQFGAGHGADNDPSEAQLGALSRATHQIALPK